MKPEDERLFFEHDLATPLTNLQGAHYLLKMVVGNDPRSADAMEVLSHSVRTLERMLGWYWRTRELLDGREAGPVEPWPASTLGRGIRERLDEERLPVDPPDEHVGKALLNVPQESLAVGLIGAAITLLAASKAVPRWELEEVPGLVVSRYSLEGDADLLDEERLFRKVYWPSARPMEAWLDPGLPYLEALLKPFGGGLELSWRSGLWRLECFVPVRP